MHTKEQVHTMTLSTYIYTYAQVTNNFSSILLFVCIFVISEVHKEGKSRKDLLETNYILVHAQTQRHKSFRLLNNQIRSLIGAFLGHKNVVFRNIVRSRGEKVIPWLLNSSFRDSTLENLSPADNWLDEITDLDTN